MYVTCSYHNYSNLEYCVLISLPTPGPVMRIPVDHCPVLRFSGNQSARTILCRQCRLFSNTTQHNKLSELPFPVFEFALPSSTVPNDQSFEFTDLPSLCIPGPVMRIPVDHCSVLRFSGNQSARTILCRHLRAITEILSNKVFCDSLYCVLSPFCFRVPFPMTNRSSSPIYLPCVLPDQ